MQGDVRPLHPERALQGSCAPARSARAPRVRARARGPKRATSDKALPYRSDPLRSGERKWRNPARGLPPRPRFRCCRPCRPRAGRDVHGPTCPRGSWLPSPPRPGWTAPPRTKGAVMQRAAPPDLEHAARRRHAAPSPTGRRPPPSRAGTSAPPAVGKVARVVTACVATMARPVSRPAGGPRRSQEPQAKARGPGGRNAITSRAAHQNQTRASSRPASGRATRSPSVVTLRGA